MNNNNDDDEKYTILAHTIAAFELADGARWRAQQRPFAVNLSRPQYEAAREQATQATALGEGCWSTLLDRLAELEPTLDRSARIVHLHQNLARLAERNN